MKNRGKSRDRNIKEDTKQSKKPYFNQKSNIVCYHVLSYFYFCQSRIPEYYGFNNVGHLLVKHYWVHKNKKLFRILTFPHTYYDIYFFHISFLYFFLR